MKWVTWMASWVAAVAIAGLIGYQLGKGSRKADATPTVSNYRADCITLTRPYEGMEVPSPFSVSGAASTFEGAIAWRLKDGNGNNLANGFETAESGIGWAPYRFEVKYPATTKGKATLEVFTGDARDGSEICTVRVPLKLKS